MERATWSARGGRRSLWFFQWFNVGISPSGSVAWTMVMLTRDLRVDMVWITAMGGRLGARQPCSPCVR